MEAFCKYRGRLAVLDRANVDTDQIIPKEHLKSIRRTGFGEALFADWRFLPDGTPNPDFELNQERYRDAGILVTRNNFGCGSSREHAVWAVVQYGFRAVVAPWREAEDGTRIPGFADIFANNAVKNGLLTIQLPPAEVDAIVEAAERFAGLEATVDLHEQRLVLHMDEEEALHFDVPSRIRDQLLRGLDDIDLTLQHESAIAAYEQGQALPRSL